MPRKAITPGKEPLQNAWAGTFLYANRSRREGWIMTKPLCFLGMMAALFPKGLKFRPILSWMKMHVFFIAAWVTLLLAAAPPAAADPAQSTTAERTYTGLVIDVNTNEQCIQVKRWLLPSKHFWYGRNCTITLLYAMLDNGVGTAGNLRRGEKVTVGYESAHGVLVADRIEQQPMQFTGRVEKINPENHLLTLHQWLANKRLPIATNCIIVVQKTRAGTLADIHPGDQVVANYELPGRNPVVWQISK